MLYPQYFIDDLKNLADLVRMIAVFMLLLVSTGEGTGQEKPKAIQTDEFGRVGCEYLYAKVDVLGDTLARNPNSTATVIISPEKNSPAKALYYKNFIKKTFQLREYALDRLRIVRGPAVESIAGTVWLVPNGADDPGRGMAFWPDVPPDLSKPFVFDIVDENNICPTFVPKVYADLIRSNPNVRGHIVVIPNSMFGSEKFDVAKEWIETLTKQYGVPRNRLKLFFAKNTNFEVVEFWIVPIKKH